MGLFSRLRGNSFDKYIAEAAKQGIKIIDVREPGEFARGHVPGAINIPLGSLGTITEIAPEKTEVLYVHCTIGSRSSRACTQLKSMGYTNAVNIGGISSYSGPIDR